LLTKRAFCEDYAELIPLLQQFLDRIQVWEMDWVYRHRVTAICPSLASHYGYRAVVGAVPDPPRFFFSLFHHVTSTLASCPYITFLFHLPLRASSTNST
jgi:hypothetical protein